ncbi:MAG: alpha/beta fold hydrolase [Rhodospirillales bacterium]
MASDGAIADRTVVVAGGRRISYREAGSGPALVLLHGVGSGAPSWDGQLAEFAPRWRTVAWDAPGYGGSDLLPMPSPAAADYADALAGFLDALGIDAAAVVGHSLGALVAAAFARRFPARVSRFVLADPAAGYGRLEPAERQSRVHGRLDLLRQYGPAGLAERRSAALLTINAPALARRRVREVMAAVRPDGYRAAVHMLREADIFADLPPAAPALVMWGEADGVTPPEACRKVAEAIPGCKRASLPGLGHACYVEDPEAFNRPLRAFLETSA